MASRSQGSKYLAEQRRKKREAEAAKAGDAKKPSSARGRVTGSAKAPRPTTGKANKGAGVRRAAAAASTATTGNRRNRSNTSKGELDKSVRAPATATGRPRSARKDVRNRDTAGMSATEEAAAEGVLKGAAAPAAAARRKATTRPSGKAAKSPAAAAVNEGWKAPKKGFLGRVGDKIKKATTLTGKPNKRKFQRGARMLPAERRKYEAAVKRWEAKAEPVGKKAGGRVGKPDKKAAKNRTPTKPVRPGAKVPAKYRGKPLPVKGDANWAAFNADMQAFSQSKPPTATMRSKPRPKPTGMKAGGRVKTAARTSVKKKSPRRP